MYDFSIDSMGHEYDRIPSKFIWTTQKLPDLWFSESNQQSMSIQTIMASQPGPTPQK